MIRSQVREDTVRCEIAAVSTSERVRIAGRPLHGKQLVSRYLDCMDVRHLSVPVVGNALEDKTELTIIAGFERCGRDRLGVDVGLVSADESQGDGLDLGGHGFVVAEENLHGHCGDGLRASVFNVAVDEGGFSSGEAGGLAHGELGERQICGVGGGRLDYVRGNAGGLTGSEDQDHDEHQNDESGYPPGNGRDAAFPAEGVN